MSLSPWHVVPNLKLDEVASLLMKVGHPRGLDEEGIDTYERWREVVIDAARRGEIEPVDIQALVHEPGEASLVWRPASLSDREAWEGVDAWNIELTFAREEVYRWLRERGASDEYIPDTMRMMPGSYRENKGDLHPRKEATYQKIIAALLVMQYSEREMGEPFRLAEQMLDDCQSQAIKAPAGRTKLGEIIKDLPSVQKADLD